MKPIALYGGSFDPVHCGHVYLAKDAVRRFSLEKLWFVPAFVSPLKPGEMTASARDRLAMLSLATANDPRLGICGWEIEKGGISYTEELLRYWKEREPGREIIFLAGLDSLLSLHRWKSWERILELARFVPYARTGVALPASCTDLHIPPEIAGRLLDDIVLADVPGVSSSGIRRRIREGEPIDGLVPPEVAVYIRERRLYK